MVDAIMALWTCSQRTTGRQPLTNAMEASECKNPDTNYRWFNDMIYIYIDIIR